MKAPNDTIRINGACKTEVRSRNRNRERKKKRIDTESQHCPKQERETLCPNILV